MSKFGVENKGTQLIGNRGSRVVTKEDYYNSFKSNMVTNVDSKGVTVSTNGTKTSIGVLRGNSFIEIDNNFNK